MSGGDPFASPTSRATEKEIYSIPHWLHVSFIFTPADRGAHCAPSEGACRMPI